MARVDPNHSHPAFWVLIQHWPRVLCVQLRPSHEAQSPMPKSVCDHVALCLGDLQSDAFFSSVCLTATTTAFWTGKAFDLCSQQHDTATLSQQMCGLLVSRGHLRIRKPKKNISPRRCSKQRGSSQASPPSNTSETFGNVRVQ